MAKRVFISYSHDSDRHASIVRNLVDRLTRDDRLWPKADISKNKKKSIVIPGLGLELVEQLQRFAR